MRPTALPDDAGLITAPSVKQLTAPAWRRLAELAEGGATVFVSYFAGPHSIQRGPWYADLDGLFGVRHRLVYGIADPVEGDQLELEFVGGIDASTRLEFAVGGSRDARSFLPVDAIDATVVAVDRAGRPALLSRALGRGRVVFATFPLEFSAVAAPARQS